MQGAKDHRERQPWPGLFALHDVVLLTFLGIAGAVTEVAPHSANRSQALSRIAFAAFFLIAGCAIGRLATSLPAWLRSLVYRVAAVGTILQGYLMLRWLLPAVNSGAVDGALLRMDERLFGGTPALWLERFATPGAVEYFSFFYFSYFALCLFTMLGVLARGRVSDGATRYAIGTALVMSLGQIGYLLVPAYGPVKYMAADFAAPLQGGYFWSLVQNVVASAGAQKDVFPSLHTALPTWFAIYAWGEARRRSSWRLPAIVLSFFAINIVVSTMFLRWHYAIDVVAGLLLATGVASVVPVLARFDKRRRRALGAAPAWDCGRIEDSAERPSLPQVVGPEH